MKLLVLTDSFPPHNLGGAGEVAHLVARGLVQRGHEVHVLAGVARRRDVGLTTNDGMTVRRVWLPVPNALRLHLSVLHPLGVVATVHAMRSIQPEAVHAHNVHERLSFVSLAAARRASLRPFPAGGGASLQPPSAGGQAPLQPPPAGGRSGGGPLLLTAHDYLLFCLTKFLCSGGSVTHRAVPAACEHCRHIWRVPARNRLVHGLVRRSVTAIACISQAQRTALAANGYADVPLAVVHNGLDPADFMASGGAGDAFRARFGIDQRPLVLFGGRISGAKGGDQLLRAIAVARRQVDCQLAILGDRKAYFRHARQLAAEVGLPPDALHTVGWLDGPGLDAAFAAADVCATPSVYPDPFNLMTLRAMGHRKAVVGTCYGATPEIVVDGETGFIADPWQPEQFGARLADLLLDRDLARRMGEAGRRRMETEFTLERQVTAYERLLTAPHSTAQELAQSESVT